MAKWRKLSFSRSSMSSPWSNILLFELQQHWLILYQTTIYFSELNAFAFDKLNANKKDEVCFSIEEETIWEKEKMLRTIIFSSSCLGLLNLHDFTKLQGFTNHKVTCIEFFTKRKRKQGKV